jgi:hypothetical protein
MMDTPVTGDDAEGRYPPYLRLVWSNPQPVRPRLRVDLARAIETHLAGADGLSREQFLAAYSGRPARLALTPR